jgi:hypothetical protein
MVHENYVLGTYTSSSTITTIVDHHVEDGRHSLTSFNFPHRSTAHFMRYSTRSSRQPLAKHGENARGCQDYM